MSAGNKWVTYQLFRARYLRRVVLSIPGTHWIRIDKTIDYEYTEDAFE